MIKDNDGNQYEVNKWIDVPVGKTDDGVVINERMMFFKPEKVQFCNVHTFNKKHECGHCPYVFVGFKAHKHIQTTNGIFERTPDHTIGKQLA